MNVYLVKRFGGALIVASNRLEAFELLANSLKRERQFYLNFSDINPNEFLQLDTSSFGCKLLTDTEEA